MSEHKTGFEESYSDDNFWSKVKEFAKIAGFEVVEKALWLYYALHEPDTPTWAKATIIGALGYFISPLDAIPDVMPFVGYSDDLGVLVLAVATVSAYINQNVKSKTNEKLTFWFGTTH